MPLKGDLRQLGKLKKNLQKLSKVPSRAAAAVSERIGDLILEEFSASQDPYGDGWQALAQATIDRKGGDDTILVRSGDLLDSVEVTPSRGAGVVIRMENYAIYHQSGVPSNNMPQRQILPSGEMPDTWKDAIEEEVADAFSSAAGEE